MGEIEAAIAREQLHKLPHLVKSRQSAAQRLCEGLSDLAGLHLPVVASNCTHVYYIFGMTLDINRLNHPRSWIINALRAEGVSALMAGYQCIHLNPLLLNGLPMALKDFHGRV